VLELSDLPGTPLSALVVSREPFSDPPPANRACTFERTRLSKDIVVVERTRSCRLISHLAYLCSLSLAIICRPSSGLRHSPKPLATQAAPSP
jgi:hypothetical protein